MTLTVLVTAAGSSIGQGIIKSIKRSSLDHRLITCDANPHAAGLYRGDVGYLVPLGRAPEFVDAIITICRTEKVRAICVGTDYELLAFAINRERIERETGAIVMVSAPDAIRIADDKWLTNQFLTKHGLPSIPSVLPEHADALAKAEGFPLIVKPRIGDSSKSTWIVSDKAELQQRLASIKQLDPNEFLDQDPGFVVQKYMGSEGEEFTTSTVTFDGRAYGVISMRREMRFGGHTTKAFVEPRREVDDAILKVALALNPFGPCNFQSRLVNDVPHVFEINCRFSGTTATCAIAGFNQVEACLRKGVLGERIEDLRFEPGMMVRYFNEVFVPMREVERLRTDGVIKDSQSRNNSSF
jgi:carbamoyl-phosphate synthase large subunit